MKDYRVFNLRSKELTANGTPKLPDADRLEYGEIAINYKDGHEVFIVKNSRNELVQFESANNDNLINMDRRFKLSSGFYTPDKAHRAIPEDLKKFGLILFYKISDNKYVFEQFVGTDIADWLVLSNWKPINGIIDNLESTSVDDALSANQGRVLNEKINDLDEYIHSHNVIDNLESESKKDPLSANQGRILNEKFIFLEHTLLPLEISTWVTPSGLSERGKAIDVTYNWSVSRKGYTNIPMTEVYVDDVKLPKPVSNIKYNISDSKKIKVKVVSTDGLNITRDIYKSFTEVIYAGLIDEGSTIDSTTILPFRQNLSNGNPILITSKSYDKNFGIVNNKVAFYAYPKDRGALTKVSDGNNFDISGLYKKGGSWNVTTLRMTVDGKPTDFYVYKSEKFNTEESVTHKFR